MASLAPSLSPSARTLSHEACQHTIFRPFPVPQTLHQWLYLCVMQGFVAGLVDFGANFGIAYAMYHSQADVRMWVFSKNTIAGDLGVTPIIQCAASMLITSTLVHTDLHNRAIPPMPFVYPHVVHLPDPRILINKVLRTKMTCDYSESATGDGEVWDEKTLRYKPLRKNSFKYYWYMLIRFIFEGNEKNMLAARCGVGNWFGRLLWTAAQGAGLGILIGFPLWCLAIVILGPIYQDHNMGNRWAPQAIKGVYGCILGWITNPIIAILALGSQSEHHLIVVPADPETGEMVGSEADQADIHTIREEDENGHAVAAQTPTDPSGRPPTGSLTPPQSPFSQPFRTHSTGHIKLHGPSSPGGPDEQVITPIKSAHLAPERTPRRARSGSITVSRPPLTANASSIGQLGTPTASSTPQRPRGLTVSSYISTTSGSSFAYALGGTGGRAQRRPRANTAASARTLPEQARVTAGGAGSGSASSGLPSPSASFMRDQPPGAWPANHSPRTSSPLVQYGRAGDIPPRLDLATDVQGGEGQDVFGRGGAVPDVVVQRPSVDVPRGGAVENLREGELRRVSEATERE